VSKRAPRREPRRRTGRAIVDALLDAASSLLASQGLAGMTTNAVAERAGVSVGSLYQYFPNKQALVSAVSERLNAALVAEVERLVGSEVAADVKLDALVALVCAVVVVAALPIAGFVLAVALVVIPPAAARFWSDRAGTVVAVAAGLGAVSAFTGAALSAVLADTPTGPAIVLVAATLFALSLLFGRARGLLGGRV